MVRLRRCGRLAQPVRHSHELGQRSRVHLPHDLATVNLHRHLAQAQFRCDLLVGSPDDNKRHDLPLALGKSSEAFAQLGKAHRLAAPFPVTLDRRVNCIEQILIMKRLAEELDGARLHRPHAHRDVPVAGDENHGQRQALFRELLVKRQSAHPWQSYVEHETARCVRRLALQKLLRRGEHAHLKAHTVHEILERQAHRWIIVDDEDDGSLLNHDETPLRTDPGPRMPSHPSLYQVTARIYGAGSLTGNEKENAVPWGVFAAADRRPPCASRIDRLIDKPMPSPSSLVVKKGSNRRGACSGSSPVPESRTSTDTVSGPSEADTIVNSRCRSLIPLIASIALMIRLSSTCCSCTLSQRTSGRPWPSRVSTRISLRRSWYCASAVTSRIVSLMSNHSLRGAWRFMSARMRRMTSAALLPSLAMRSSARRALSICGGLVASQRAPAAALVTMAPSG